MQDEHGHVVVAGWQLLHERVGDLLDAEPGEGLHRLPQRLEPGVQRGAALLDEPVRVDHQDFAGPQVALGVGPPRADPDTACTAWRSASSRASSGVRRSSTSPSV